MTLNTPPSVPRPQQMAGDAPPQDRDGIIKKALELGVSRATLLPASVISIRQSLADLCRSCPNHGLALSCPPRVGEPEALRQWTKVFSLALFFSIDVETNLLMSSQRRDVFRALHGITAEIECRIVNFGFSRAMGFAGGSCKSLFCSDHLECSALNAPELCRFPGQARPSMSGFGIDVAALIQAAGWQKESFLEDRELKASDRQGATPSDATEKQEDLSGIYGMVLLR